MPSKSAPFFLLSLSFHFLLCVFSPQYLSPVCLHYFMVAIVCSPSFRIGHGHSEYNTNNWQNDKRTNTHTNRNKWSKNINIYKMSCSKLYTPNLATQTHADACVWLWLCLDYTRIKVKGKRYKMLLSNKSEIRIQNEILGYTICFIPLFFSIFDNSIVLQAVFCFSCAPLFCTHSFIWITNKSQGTKRLAPIYTLLDSFFSILL